MTTTQTFKIGDTVETPTGKVGKVAKIIADGRIIVERPYRVRYVSRELYEPAQLKRVQA